MKILNAEQIRLADQYTIKNEPIQPIDLMERASEAFVSWFVEQFDSTQSVIVISGNGNNGGDGLAIARILSGIGYSVSVIIAGNEQKGSKDFKINLDRLKEIKSISVSFETEFDLKQDIVIDALFGSGLTRPVSGEYAKVIEQINTSEAKVVSVDLPSGMFCDRPVIEGSIVEADHVISFQAPKLSFFLPENGRFVKNWEVVEIGLDQEFINSVEADCQTVEPNFVNSLIRPRPKYYHKGQAGRALLVTGSTGKLGASILCARACLKSGIGLLEVHIPNRGNDVLQISVPEAMVILDRNLNHITEHVAIDKYNTIGFGPGIGQEKDTVKAFSNYLLTCDKPIVIDADAINILSSNPNLILNIPTNSILTPHPGEFRRLVGDWANDYVRLEMQKEFSAKHNVIVVLKNAHTSTTLPDGSVFFNTTGNPGMATAGSGDVLTGIITGFLGQGYHPWEAAVLAVYLHGLAGDFAKETLGAEESITATDILENLHHAIAKSSRKL